LIELIGFQYTHVVGSLICSVVSSHRVSTVWTRVHNIFAGIQTKWEQATE